MKKNTKEAINELKHLFDSKMRELEHNISRDFIYSLAYSDLELEKDDIDIVGEMDLFLKDILLDTNTKEQDWTEELLKYDDERYAGWVDQSDENWEEKIQDEELDEEDIRKINALGRLFYEQLYDDVYLIQYCLYILILINDHKLLDEVWEEYKNISEIENFIDSLYCDPQYASSEKVADALLSKNYSKITENLWVLH